MRHIFMIALVPALLAGATTARAHATLATASPAVGSAVPAAPQAVLLSFTEKLEPAFSVIRVLNSAGARVDQGKAQVDRANPTVLKVGVRPLPPGTYKVQWRVLSVDTHTTEGSFSFRVGQ
jgi:methionine-rich copper-binding protein CopC